jgi:hypothetical protein
MSDSALRAALQKLLAQGEQASDNRMLKAHAAKNAPPAAAPEMCPECQKPLAEGKCVECGYEAPAEGAEDSELAGLLEAGAEG